MSTPTDQKPAIYTSVAKWPHPAVRLGNAANESRDTHGSFEAAQAVVDRLRIQGFGGDGLIFPLTTYVEDESGTVVGPYAVNTSPDQKPPAQYFRHKGGFGDGARAIMFSDGKAFIINKSGKIRETLSYDLAYAEECVRDGDWEEFAYSDEPKSSMPAQWAVNAAKSLIGQYTTVENIARKIEAASPVPTLVEVLGNASDELENYIADCQNHEAPEEVDSLRKLVETAKAMVAKYGATKGES